MNKIDTQRYHVDDQQDPLSSPKYKLKTQQCPRHSHALSRLVQKQTQIDTVKKRISALCLRQQKYTHRTLNSQQQLQRRQAIRKETQRIRHLLVRQRQKQSQNLQILKYKNIKARAGNYFRMRTLKQKKDQYVHQISDGIRNRSKHNDSTIREQKLAVIESKKEISRNVKCQSLQTKQAKSRVIQQRKEQIQIRQFGEVQHFSKLEQIKTGQLAKLSQLQLMMVQKSQISKAAYETTRSRLQKETNYHTDRAVKTSRDSNPQITHMNLYY